MSKEKPIPCPRGCGKKKTKIGRKAVTLRFKFTAGQGKITGINGLDEAPFSHKRPDDPDYLIDYAGTGSDPKTWKYEPISVPSCPPTNIGEDPEPELTNEPE